MAVASSLPIIAPPTQSRRWRSQLEFYKDYRDNERRKVAEVSALEFIDSFLAHGLPSRFRHVRQYGFLAPKGRETKLKAIREMLGYAEEDADAFQQERNKFSGDLDLEAVDEKLEGYPCPVCGQGRMVRGEETPRPTVPQILAIPFIIWTAIASDGAQQQREQSERRQQEKLLRVQRDAQQPPNREREEAIFSCPTESPSNELRQQLLPLAFW